MRKRYCCALITLLLCATSSSPAQIKEKSSPRTHQYLTLIRTLRTRNNETIRSVSFSPDGLILASGIVDGTVRLWRVADGQLLGTLRGNGPTTEMVAFSPDGSILATGDSSKVLLWHVSDKKLLRSLSLANGTTEFLNEIAFSPDGQFLLAVTANATTLWRVMDGTLVQTFAEERTETPKYSYQATFNPSGQMLFTVGTGIKQWRVSDGTLLTLLAKDKVYYRLALNSNGRVLAAGRYAAIDLLESLTGRSMCTLQMEGMVGQPEALVFNPVNEELLVSSYMGETRQPDDKIRLWRIDECRQVQAIFKGDISAYFRLAFSLDGRLLAVGGSQTRGKFTLGIVRLFQVKGN